MGTTLSARRMKNIAINRPKPLSAIVAERIKQMIFRREFELGEMLSEEQIASSMNVSRTPVREAFYLLQLQGLITILPQRGSFVFNLDSEDLEALVQYRLILETQAAPLAIVHDPVNAAAKLYKAISLLTTARDTDDVIAYAEADTMFHNVFFDFCGNHYLKEAHEMASGRLAALRAHLSKPLQVHRGSTFFDHIEIADLFSKGKLNEALEILSQHISAMSINYKKALVALEEMAKDNH